MNGLVLVWNDAVGDGCHGAAHCWTGAPAPRRCRGVRGGSRAGHRHRAGDGTNAFRTSPVAPLSKQLASALARVFGEDPVQIRTSGATVPVAPFIDAMGFPAISVPIVNFDNNQHGENENLRLGDFFRGIVTLAAVLTM